MVSMSEEPRAPINDRSPTWIRTRLVEIDDELRSLAADAFAAKHPLNVEADALRRALSDGADGESASILTTWADRAARKGAHSVDDGVEAAKAAIVSPGEGGGTSS
jgi:pyocin large subunit-like protein